MRCYPFASALWTVCLTFLCGGLSLFAKELPRNIAPLAVITATSEYNEDYTAKYVADGVIPPAGSKADLKHAWCVKNETAQNHAALTFEWKEPVDVAEIVYFGRTAWFVGECWKNYTVFADDQEAARGQFAAKHGGQTVKFPPQKAKTIKIVFDESFGGLNPGASEIMIFGAHADDTLIRKLTAVNGSPIEDLDSPERDYLLKGFTQILAIKRFEIYSSHVYTYHYEGFRAGGGLYVCSIANHKQRAAGEDSSENSPLIKKIVDAGQGQILNADLSYDGKTVLFAWRRKQAEPYHLWTVNIDGSNLKQVTDGPWHDYDACWLPDGDVAFLSSRSPQFAYCWNAPVGTLHRMSLDGSNLIRLSDNYLNDFTPTVLDDGRIIYGRWEYVDRPAIPIQSLWTVRQDGTNLQTYFGNRVLSPATFIEARSIPGSTKIVCTMTGHNGHLLGAIGVIDRRHGDNSQESIENVTPEVPVDKVDRGSGNHWPVRKYCNPYPLDNERFLTTNQGAIEVRTFALKDKQPECSAVLLTKPANGMFWFNAYPIRPRSKPDNAVSTASALLREGKTASAPNKNHATLAIQDVYQGLDGVKRGEVAAIRVVREMQKTVRIEPNQRSFGFQFPVISCGATYAGKMLVGDIPVESDGSAYFSVGMTKQGKEFDDYTSGSINAEGKPVSAPVTGPIYFIALDKEGRAIQRMRSFTHLMSGEQQTCIGCHESRTSAPVSAMNFTKAMSREPVEPKLPFTSENEPFAPGFNYVKIVQPILDKYCVECHHPKNAPKNVDLSGGYTEYFNVSYDVLASENQGKKGSPFVNWIPTYNGDEQNILDIRPKAWGSYQSPLAELIRNGHPDKDGKQRFTMDEDSKRKIYCWIDLNVPYYASSETSYPNILGCRRIYPPTLDRVLNEVGKRRCAECHQNGNRQRVNWIHRTQNQTQYPEEGSPGIVPRRSWVRITEPELNPFLLAPLAKSAGGTGKCVVSSGTAGAGSTVFYDKNDPDYIAILRCFEPTTESLKKTPRIDMPGGKPAEKVCRLTN